MTKAVKEKFRKLPPSPSVINFLKRKKEKLTEEIQKIEAILMHYEKD